jgi:hypothetical protein
VKTPRFSGPFKWLKVRDQLLSLREDVQSVQKIAGENVDLNVYPGKGTVINVAGDSTRRGGGGGGPCVPELTVTFAGIVIDCGCNSNLQKIETESSINGTFVIPLIGTGDGFCEWSGDGGFTFVQVYSDTGCTDLISSGLSNQYGIDVQFFDGSGYFISYQGPGTVYFNNTGGNLGVPISNDCVCNFALGIPSVAHSGTATLSA